MRIWYVPTAFPVGSETFATNEVRILRRRGMDVEVHSYLPARPDADKLLAERELQGLRLTHGSLCRHLLGLFSSLRHAPATFFLIVFILRMQWARPRRLVVSLLLVPRTVQMFAQLRRHPPDVLHLYWGHYPCLLGYLVRRYLPTVVLSISLIAHDLDMKYELTAPVARSADVVWTIARANLAALKAMGIASERIEVAYQGVDFEKLATGVAKVPFRILFAGRLIPEKGAREVLEVFRLLRERWPDATLTILGDGPELPHLEALARASGCDSAVRLPGHVSQETVYAEMAAAEVFLFPSRFENERLPNVVKEAMASRCICVVSDTRGIEEVVDEGQTGYIVPARDLELARDRVAGIFADRSATRTMQEQAARHIAEHFNLHDIIQRYQSRWEELVKRARSEALPSPRYSGERGRG